MKSKKILALAFVMSCIAALAGCNTTPDNSSQYTNAVETSHKNSHSNIANPQVWISRAVLLAMIQRNIYSMHKLIKY